MLLSVVIPTLNRLDYLKVTLEKLLPQIERNINEVELCVCINNSKDKTEEYIKNLQKEKPFLRLKSYYNSVEISESFSRSIDMCLGSYVIIFGDDDIPSPFLVDFILRTLKNYQNLSFIHFNRIVGKDLEFDLINKLRLEEEVFLSRDEIYNIGQFVEKFTVSPGFICSMVFKKEVWNLGDKISNEKHFGYEFLSRIYYGIKKRGLSSDCFYSSFPFVVQRMVVKREWNDKWPMYWLVGVPNLLSDMDKLNITSESMEAWHNNLNKSTKKFIYILLWSSSVKRKYKPLIKDIQKYQSSNFRKLLVFLFINFMPKFVFKYLRSLLYK